MADCTEAFTGGSTEVCTADFMADCTGGCMAVFLQVYSTAPETDLDALRRKLTAPTAPGET